MIHRPEIETLEENGYEWNDLFDIIKIFEDKISRYTGAPYVTVTDCCTHALELSFRYLQKQGPIKKVSFPAYTYLSVPMMLKKINIDYEMLDNDWQGYYQFEPTNVVDMAIRFTKDCYIKNKFCCVSFGDKKVVKIIRGGAILTDNRLAHDYFQRARYDGRDLKNVPWTGQKEYEIGYHYNLSIDDCARGIILMDELAKQGLHNKDAIETGKKAYPNLKDYKFNF